MISDRARVLLKSDALFKPIQYFYNQRFYMLSPVTTTSGMIYMTSVLEALSKTISNVFESKYVVKSQCTPSIFNQDQKFHGLFNFYCLNIDQAAPLSGNQFKFFFQCTKQNSVGHCSMIISVCSSSITVFVP